MTELGITRWDPASRAGAVATRKRTKTDVQALDEMQDIVMDWAGYQKLAGEVDQVETSAIRGTYNWQSYIHEETSIARRREADRNKRAPKTERAPVPPAPAALYL